VATTAGGKRSTNNGDSWGGIGLYESIIWSLAINSSGHIFAGAHSYAYVYRSTDNGNTWTSLLNTLVWCFAINSSGYIFAGTGNGVLLSTDNGDDWMQTDLTDTWVFALAVNDSGDIFAGTDSSGVLRSSDNGDSWIQTDLSGIRVNTLAVNNSGDIFAGTDSGGIFRSSNNGDNWIQTGLINSIEEINQKIPDSYILNQNYPNPFNHKTVINYELPIISHVDLVIYNLLGQKVATVVSERQPAGYHRVEWEAGDVSSGVYYYMITAGEFQAVKKMLLIK